MKVKLDPGEYEIIPAVPYAARRHVIGDLPNDHRFCHRGFINLDRTYFIIHDYRFKWYELYECTLRRPYTTISLGRRVHIPLCFDREKCYVKYRYHKDEFRRWLINGGECIISSQFVYKPDGVLVPETYVVDGDVVHVCNDVVYWGSRIFHVDKWDELQRDLGLWREFKGKLRERPRVVYVNGVTLCDTPTPGSRPVLLVGDTVVDVHNRKYAAVRDGKITYHSQGMNWYSWLVYRSILQDMMSG